MQTALLERLRVALLPDYEVERELGSGGMGTVFLAREVKLERSVAIKILKPEMATATAAERFLREARMLASLSDPNIVPIHAVGEADGLFYYTMDRVEGATLADRLSQGSLPVDEAVSLADQLLSALEAVHGRGIVHRDIKPSNIFLVGDRVLLSDFGIAKKIDSVSPDLTAPDRAVGTPGYMAPEQAAGEEIAPASDIYVVGMVLYEAITARKWSILSRPAEVDWSGVRPRLALVLRRALAWSPEDRPDAVRFRTLLSAAAKPPIARRAAVAAMALTAVVALWVFIGGPGGEDGPASDLAVLPFEIAGGTEGQLGRDVARLAALQLERFPNVTVTPPRVSFPWSENAPPERAHEELKTKRVAYGTLVVNPDGRVSLQLDVLDSTGDLVPSQGRIALDRLDLQALSDSVTLRLLQIVRPEDLPELARPVTNVEALQYFLQGEEAFDRGRWAVAVAHYEAVVGLDPGFALAWWKLANAWRWRGFSGPYPDADFQRLFDQYASELGPRDSLLMEAQLTPAGAERLEKYRQALTDYPQDDFAAFLYGEELFNRGPLWGAPLEDAVRALEGAVGVNRFLVPAYEPLIWANIRLGREADARAWLDSLDLITERLGSKEVGEGLHLGYLEPAYYFRFEPERKEEVGSGMCALGLCDAEDLSWISRLGASFDIPGAEVELAGLVVAMSSLPMLQGGGRVAQGLGYAGLGLSQLALAQFDAAAEIFDTPEAHLQAADWRVLPGALGVPWADEGERNRGRESLQALVESPLGPRAVWALAMDAYVNGDLDAARGWSERLRDAPSDGGVGRLYTFLRAMEEAKQGRYESALDVSEPLLEYQAMTVLLSGAPELKESLGDPFARAALHLKRGEWFALIGDDLAAEREWLWYEAVDIDGLPAGEAQAGEIDWALGPYGRSLRGTAALRRGDPEAACRHLSRVAELWSEADGATAELAREAGASARQACDGVT